MRSLKEKRMHHHITMSIDSDKLRAIQDYLKSDFAFIDVDITPDDPEITNELRKIFLHILGSIRDYKLPV